MAKARSRATTRETSSDVNGEWHFYDERMNEDFPLLHAFMFGRANEYGEDHNGGSLTLFEKGGHLKFRLFDKTTKETGWGGAVDACDVFKCIEDQLREHTIEWEESKGSFRN